MIDDDFLHQLPDTDPTETREWIESLDAVIDARGPSRARYLLATLLERARDRDLGTPMTVTTPYINTIPPDDQPWFPGDASLEKRIRAFIRWNAAVMVVRANHRSEGIGGHLSTFASSAALYDVGYHHFFRGTDDGRSGDQVYVQGHAAPGVYARAYVEGRLDEAQLDRFRREIDPQGRTAGGLSSYPHPRLMPELWEFPTVSMGLGPLASLYQARFNRYLLHRQLIDTSASRVWAFVGDGECDEPETLGSISLGSRERLDNLIWVVSCNLQRLDGPVRGNGKVIQELEATFRGAGWHVIKVVWGSGWDELLAADTDGLLLERMNETVDGEFQRYATESGAYIREHFFGPDPRLRAMVAHLSDEQLQALPRGGHDDAKLYAAYKLATEQRDAPTAILAKTVKGWALGSAVESRNATHQIKKMSLDQLAELRERLRLDDVVPDPSTWGDEAPYCRPSEGSAELAYLRDRRRELGGPVPRREVRTRNPLAQPGVGAFEGFDAGSGSKEVSTTGAFTRLLRDLARDPEMGRRVVPIIPDEARTFGMDALFRELRIYASQGQRYEPVDHSLLLSYEEARDGQILEEGITEAGAMASFLAAGTAYATHGTPMVPFFTFYSMFGFQRVGDLIWAASDARARGFLLGATAGRTTLAGEGLQHQDGHSPLLASTVPTVRCYDPAFAYETAAIVREGLARMYPDAHDAASGEDVIYYLTLYNEPIAMPARPAGVTDEHITAGLYRWAASSGGATSKATILFSGAAQAAARAAQVELADRWDVDADLWSATSYKALREEALSVERWNRLHPTAAPRTALVTSLLGAAEGPVVAVTDFLKAVPDQIARWVPAPFTPLGTDGFGRSDDRATLRRYFEVDAGHVVVAVLAALAAGGSIAPSVVADAIAAHGIDPELPDPRTA